MAQKCSKLIRLVPIVLTVIQENFFLYHHIPTTMLYCTDCFIPPGVSFPPFIKLWKGEFFKGWILDVGDGIFPNRMREGEGAESLFHMSWGGGGAFWLFYFLAIFSMIYIILDILIYKWGECLNRVNFWYLPLGSFSYIYKTWWYF